MLTKMLRNLLPALLLVGSMNAGAGEIVVRSGSSIHDALRQAREWRRTADKRCEGGITITVKAGRYFMHEPLFLRPEDSGTASSPLVIRGEEGTVVCGNPRQQHTQLFPTQGMAPLLAFDPDARTVTVPLRHRGEVGPFLCATDNVTPFEMVIHQRWAIAILRVQNWTVTGDSVVVSFCEPESRLEFEHPWPQPVIGGEKGNSSFLLRTTEQRDGVEQLVVVDGASHVTFEHLTFENTCWNRPLHKGHVTLQGGFPLVDAYKLKEHEGLPWDKTLENQAWIERPVSAVSISRASEVNILDCTFRQTGATALDFIDDTEDCVVSGCVFDAIGGTAIMAGSFAESPREVHRPYTDLAKRCKGLRIQGNRISRVGQEDWGSVAIGCGYVCNTAIVDNTVTNCPYSGICVGWGWTPHDTGMKHNVIQGNKVSYYARQLYDAGGIYTLSNQPDSEIRDNLIAKPSVAPYATNDRAFPIYLDARTDGFTIINNKIDDSPDAKPRPVRRNEIGDNHPGPSLVFVLK